MNKKVLVAATTLLAAITLTACGNTENDTQGGTKVSKSDKKNAQSKIKFYKKGDTVKVGKVEYTLKSATPIAERNQFEKKQPKYVIKVVYHVKNDGKEDLPIGGDLDVYGPDNEKLKDYPIDDQTMDSIAPGKEADVITGLGTKKLGAFELHFKSLVDFDSKAAKFKVNIK
jgi:predicted small secreted protein